MCRLLDNEIVSAFFTELYVFIIYLSLSFHLWLFPLSVVLLEGQVRQYKKRIFICNSQKLFKRFLLCVATKRTLKPTIGTTVAGGSHHFLTNFKAWVNSTVCLRIELTRGKTF